MEPILSILPLTGLNPCILACISNKDPADAESKVTNLVNQVSTIIQATLDKNIAALYIGNPEEQHSIIAYTATEQGRQAVYQQYHRQFQQAGVHFPLSDTIGTKDDELL